MLELDFSLKKSNDIFKEGSKRLPNECTVSQAEIMAIKMAMVELVANPSEDDSYIKIFSDSRAAIQALNNSTVSSQIVKDTISALNLVGAKASRLEVSWIRAHVGHLGKERADQLARNTADLALDTQDILLP